MNQRCLRDWAVVLEWSDAGLLVDGRPHPWADLHDAIETPTVLVVFAGSAGPIIIPRRAFASAGDDRAFRDELRRRGAYRCPGVQSASAMTTARRTKYAILIPDGAADDPLPQLGNRTPLAAAHTPNLDWVAAHGRLGTARTVPDGFESGSATWPPCPCSGTTRPKYHTGRAPLEAAAQRIPLVAGRLGVPPEPGHGRSRRDEGPLGPAVSPTPRPRALLADLAAAVPLDGFSVSPRRQLPQPARLPRAVRLRRDN